MIHAIPAIPFHVLSVIVSADGGLVMQITPALARDLVLVICIVWVITSAVCSGIVVFWKIPATAVN
jgi:hypothetical protein